MNTSHQFKIFWIKLYWMEKTNWIDQTLNSYKLGGGHSKICSTVKYIDILIRLDCPLIVTMIIIPKAHRNTQFCVSLCEIRTIKMIGKFSFILAARLITLVFIL